MRYPPARRIDAKHPIRDPSGLAEQILGIADTLTQILEHAAAQRLPVPPSVSNSVHELRGWRPTPPPRRHSCGSRGRYPDHRLPPRPA